jgi:hypothetical protein
VNGRIGGKVTRLFRQVGYTKSTCLRQRKIVSSDHYRRISEEKQNKHSQSNGAAENSVKTFKNKIKALLLDAKCNRENINSLISRFLISYRNTKHAITKETRAKVLIGRELRTKLSFLKEDKDDQREIERVKSENAQKLHRRFKVGDVVMARDHRTLNERTWTENNKTTGKNYIHV